MGQKWSPYQISRHQSLHVPLRQFQSHQSCTHPKERKHIGLFEGLLGSLIMSRTSRRVKPLYQSRLVGLSIILSHSKPYFTVHWCRGIFLISAANHLLHTNGESKQCMLSSLSILGNVSFKTTSDGINPTKKWLNLIFGWLWRKRWSSLSYHPPSNHSNTIHTSLTLPEI